ncbi:MAG: MFS transporter [Candidatus Aenigmatarchaeota archaeon]
MEVEKKIRSSYFFFSLGSGFFNPFLTMFAISIGATNFQIGLLSALMSFFTVIFQLLSIPLFNFAKDKLKIYIVVNFFAGLLFIPLAYTKDVYVLIYLVVAQSVLLSISNIIRNEILIQIFPKWRRGREIGAINSISTVANIISYTIGGIVIRMFGFVPYIFYVSFFFYSILGNFSIFNLKLNKFIGNGKDSSIKEIIKDKEFIKFTFIVSLFSFSVGVGAPLFDLHLIRNLGFDSLELAFRAIISLLTYYFFSESVGKACDLLGIKTIMFFGLPLISLYPFLYAIGTKPIWIYLVTILCDLGWVAFNTSTFLYLSNISSEKSPSKYFAFYNSITSLFSTLGRFLSAYLVQQMGIVNVLILSSVLRFLTSFSFAFLHEKRKYYFVFPFPFISFNRITSYLDEFFSTYSYIIAESKKSKIDVIIRNFRKFLKEFF